MRKKSEYIRVGQIVMSHEEGGNYASWGTDVYGCSRCGVLVFDREKHDNSHTMSGIGLGI